MSGLTFEQLFFLFPVAVTLHNLEEAVLLPDWSQKAGPWHRPVGKTPFRFAVLILTLLAYVFTYFGFLGGKQSIGIYLLSGYAVAMALNAFFPHLFVAMRLGQYVPGLVTALLLTLPVCTALLYFVVVHGYVSPWPLAITGALFVFGLLLLIRLLFKIGEKIEERYSFTLPL